MQNERDRRSQYLKSIMQCRNTHRCIGRDNVCGKQWMTITPWRTSTGLRLPSSHNLAAHARAGAATFIENVNTTIKCSVLFEFLLLIVFVFVYSFYYWYF